MGVNQGFLPDLVFLDSECPKEEINPNDHFLLYDLHLEEDPSPSAKDRGEWVQKLHGFIQSFPHRLGVYGGEGIKDWKNFPRHLESVVERWPRPFSLLQGLVVFGGGSLGDFGGFLASILKRGIPLIHVPTTWLAAIDSSHGGKNGLNAWGGKNQLGTFYPAHKIFICKKLLEALPKTLKSQSYGELIKMGLIGPSRFFKKIIQAQGEGEDFLNCFAEDCIKDKYHFVLKDPYETQKTRQILNFGHTMGHAFEIHWGLSHGESVLQGIFFALQWSRHLNHLDAKTHGEIEQAIEEKFQTVANYKKKGYQPIPPQDLLEILKLDKKTIHTKAHNVEIHFVFLKQIGKPWVQTVRFKDLIQESQRQGWVGV